MSSIFRPQKIRKRRKYLDVHVVTFSFPYAISRSSVSKEWLSFCAPLLPAPPIFLEPPTIPTGESTGSLVPS